MGIGTEAQGSPVGWGGVICSRRGAGSWSQGPALQGLGGAGAYFRKAENKIDGRGSGAGGLCCPGDLLASGLGLGAPGIQGVQEARSGEPWGQSVPCSPGGLAVLFFQGTTSLLSHPGPQGWGLHPFACPACLSAAHLPPHTPHDTRRSLTILPAQRMPQAQLPGGPTRVSPPSQPAHALLPLNGQPLSSTLIPQPCPCLRGL